MKENEFTIVTGIPRSGTSMMMNMLEVGGVPALTDCKRKPDKDNPNGYFELEAVKNIEKDVSFIEQARGEALKVVSFLLPYLPPDRVYNLVFMQRNLQEIRASQNQVLVLAGKDSCGPSDSRWERIFNDHLEKIKSWIKAQKHFRVFYVDYRQAVRYPKRIARELEMFLGRGLDLDAMTRVVDPRLYRHRV